MEREKEVDEITAILQRDDCRLLTLVGSGGIGKTRLAVTIWQSKPFPTCYFVDLQQATDVMMVVSAIGEAIQMAWAGSQLPQDQLIECLQLEQGLLILDNAEHIPDIAMLLSAILAQTPHLKMLVTSREVLKLHEEHIYRVQAMGLPDAESANPEAYSAVQLLIERAQQDQHGFDFGQWREDVLAICQSTVLP